MKHFFFLLLVTPLISFGQIDEGYEQYVLSESLPAELRGKMYDKGFFDLYKLNAKLNPFYLRGDFNGDQQIDYAISVQEKSTNKIGIAIFTSLITYELVGAGKKMGNREIDDFRWMDAWSVYIVRNVEHGVGESKKISLNSDAIQVIKTESSSGLIYWDGGGISLVSARRLKLKPITWRAFLGVYPKYQT